MSGCICVVLQRSMCLLEELYRCDVGGASEIVSGTSGPVLQQLLQASQGPVHSKASKVSECHCAYLSISSAGLSVCLSVFICLCLSVCLPYHSEERENLPAHYRAAFNSREL